MKKILGIKFTVTTIISVGCFLAAVIIGLTCLAGKIFFKTEDSVYITQYVWLGYMAFIFLFIAIIVPLFRRLWVYLRIKHNPLLRKLWMYSKITPLFRRLLMYLRIKHNPIDGLATILLAVFSSIPLVFLWWITFFLLKRYPIGKYKIVRFTCRVTTILIGAFVFIHGKRDKNAPFVIAPHTAWLDYLLGILIMDEDELFNIVSGINLSDLKLQKTKPTFWDKCIAITIGRLVRDYSIPIDRDDEESRKRVALRIIRDVKDGRSIMLYPEGTRMLKSKIKQGVLLQDFQDGIFRIAFEIKKPIQPVVFIWPVMWRGKGDDWWGVHPGRTDLYYLPPINPCEYENYEEFRDACWNAMYEKLKSSKKVQRFVKELQVN